ncbi:MAG TPA: hypothetical protein VLH09_10855 [Bryobacteraceae bacterium]|nr:hypothetical protein [Bryobacteraceae bacterium]
MRFFRLRLPADPRVLLVESGSRQLLEGVIPYLRDTFGDDVPIDLATCYSGRPAGLREGSVVYHTHAFRGRRGRKRLYRELLTRRISVLVVVCSGEPIMTKWKWSLALRLPVRLLVVNENGDFFWFDRTNWSTIRHFILFRAGLSGGDAVRTIGQILLFPVTLAYLLCYAAVVHLRRKVHI